MGEAYDARLYLGPWSSPGFDEVEWTAVRIAETPNIEILHSAAPPVRDRVLVVAFFCEREWKAENNPWGSGKSIGQVLQPALFDLPDQNVVFGGQPHYLGMNPSGFCQLSKIWMAFSASLKGIPRKA